MPRLRRRYKKPPLVEVVCAFGFEYAEGGGWDEFLVPDFYEAIEGQYPLRRQPLTAGMQPAQVASRQADQMDRDPSFGRYQFYSDDGKTSLRVDGNGLVINQLPPYYSWERFEPRVLDALDLYANTWHTSGVVQAVLQYVDRIEIPENHFRLQDYFNLYPAVPDDIKSPIANLSMSFQIAAEREGDVLVVFFRQYPSASPVGSSFLLCWSYVASGSIGADRGSIGQWLKCAHAFTGENFRAALTEKCEQLFEPEGPRDE